MDAMGADPAGAELPDLLQRIVGAAHVIVGDVELDRRARTTLSEGARPGIVVRPGSREEVQEVVRAAARCGTAVYPISAGKNWGYGDACPTRDGQIVIDLSRMDRIIAVDAELAYAVIEPGVTQRQLYEHLAAAGIPLWMDCTGAGPDASILGNVMERGFGHSRYGDRATHVCGLEFVLADGEVLRTGSAAIAGGKGEHVYKPGLGPDLDGLFTQSNLGILTRATVWLMPAPERFCAFFATLADPDAIGPFVDAMRRLRLSGTVRSTVHIFNDMRMLGSSTRFPRDIADGTAALEVAHPDLCQRLMREHRVAAWSASGCLTGTAREIEAARAAVRRTLRGVPGMRLAFVGPRAMRFADLVRGFLDRHRLLPSLRHLLETLRLGYDLQQGRPSYGTLAGGHWRARGDPGAAQDPLDSGSGMFWVSPILPMASPSISEVQRIGAAVLHDHGFEYQVTYSLVSDRALCAVMSICFDKADAAEGARARRCHDALVDRLLAAGYLPYRGALPTVARCRAAAPAFWSVAERLKRALDPDGIIAPGRYIPESGPPERGAEGDG
jgi:4-cresol dehydrogenase (hydroxylating) flavoprotein subunit